MSRAKPQADHTETHNAVIAAIRQYMAWSKAWSLKVAGGAFQRPGVPDILACWPPTGRLVAVEVKTGRGKLTEKQREELGALALGGAVCVVAASVDDLERALLKSGLIKNPLVVSERQAATWRAEQGFSGLAVEPGQE